MAVAFKAALGSGVATGSGNQVTWLTTANIDVGDLVVLRVASDNLSATTPTFTGIGGPAGTWVTQRQGAVNATAAAGVAGAIITIKATAFCPSGTAIGAQTSANVAHKACYAESFTGVENTVRSAAVSATGASTSAISPASGTVAVGDLVLGFVAWETRGTLTGDADTGGGTWSTITRLPSATSGSDATCVSVGGQYKIPNTTTAQTYNVTGSSAEWLAGVLVLQATPDPAITQAAYQWFGEGTESGAVALAAQDTPVTGDITNGDATGTLRVRLQATTAVTVPASDDWQLQYEKNTSGTWVNITPSSLAVQTYDSPNLTGTGATTNRLTGGTGGFTAGEVSEDGTANDKGWAGNGFTEFVYALKVIAADLADGDALRFRVLRNGATTTMTYTITPTINLIKSVLPQTWTGSDGGVGVAGITGVWIAVGPPQTWDGSIAEVGAAGQSGVLVAGAVTWSGTTATVGAAGQTGIFTPGAVTWAGSDAAIGAAGQSASLVAGGITWVGSDATIGVAGTSGTFIATAPSLVWDGSVAIIGAAGTSGTLVGGVVIWAGSTASVGVAGISLSLTPGAVAWVGTDASLGVAGQSGTIVGGATIWAGSTAAVGVAGQIGTFILGAAPQTWVGSTAAAGVAGQSGPFIAAPQTWAGSTAAIGAAGQTGVLVPGVTLWVGSVAGVGVAGQPGGFSFKPINIVGCGFWLDASQLALADGAAVNVWTDLSGFGRHLTPTAGTAPTLQTNEQNGLPVVRYDGVGNVLTASVAADYKHFFVVAKYNQAVFDSYDGLITGISGNDLLLLGNAGTSNLYPPLAGGAQGNCVYRKNGTVDPTFVGPMAAWAHMGISAEVGWPALTVQIGLDRVHAPRFWDGDVAEVIAYDRVLSDPERLQVEQYLFEKWFPPPQTWAGSIAAVGAAALSGAVVGGAVTWAGSTATIGVAGQSAAFVPGARVWVGSTATVGVAGQSGLITSAQAWAGSTAMAGAAAQSGIIVGGATIWAGSTALVGTAGQTKPFVPGATTWTGSIAAVGVTAETGAFLSGVRVWAGSTGAAGVTSQSDLFVAGEVFWYGSLAEAGVEAVSDLFVAGMVVWDGSLAEVGVAAETGTWTTAIGLWNGQEVSEMMWGAELVSDFLLTAPVGE